MKSRVKFIGLCGLVLASLPAEIASAAEGGIGVYLLGSKGPAAAITPPPGLYLENDFYFYRGTMGKDEKLPAGGRLAVGIEGDAALYIPSLSYIAPEPLLGGHLGLSVSLPVGKKETDADLTLRGPRGGHATGAISDDILTIGDPKVGAYLGWQTGNFHYQLGTQFNVPIGDYHEGAITNLAFHRWGTDIFAAATWLDPTIGLDISGAAGVTFNSTNTATDYKTGNEFHFEGAMVQHFNKSFDAGLIGYYYKQLGADSGSGASGAFKGEVAAIGVTLGYSFKAGELPMAARLKYYHEVSAENRPKGDAVYVTLSMPLKF
ncbi:transporter [Brucella sp. BE17]|uniref:SphA family protein n=1 Tax=Brucella sp. BE17 TaxID=3142977 RepID=UPI0031BBA130